MNKLMRVTFAISALLCVGFISFLLLNQQSDKINFNSTTVNWLDIEPKIINECEKKTIMNDEESKIYFLTLFNSTGQKVKYDSKRDDFFPEIGKAAYVLDLNPKDDVKCWVVWVGDFSGNGVISYEKKAGGLKTLRIKSFPSPFNIRNK